jgi:hypothetical protein
MSRSRAAIRVAVIGGEERYPMFDAAEVAADGGFFAGPLLLETGEQLEVELSFADDTTLRLSARVVDVSAGDRPGIQVIWSELGDDDRALLESKLTNGEIENGRDG